MIHAGQGDARVPRAAATISGAPGDNRTHHAASAPYASLEIGNSRLEQKLPYELDARLFVLELGGVGSLGDDIHDELEAARAPEASEVKRSGNRDREVGRLDELLGPLLKSVVAKGTAFRSLLLSDPESDVSDGLVGVVHGVRECGGNLDRVVFCDPGKRDDRLIADFRTRIAKGAVQALLGATIANFTQGCDGHLANRAVDVLDRNEERREALSCAEIREGNGSLGANSSRAVVPEQSLEDRYGARAHGICGQGMPYQIAYRGRAS
jgi:hypothetical protein